MGNKGGGCVHAWVEAEQRESSNMEKSDGTAIDRKAESAVGGRWGVSDMQHLGTQALANPLRNIQRGLVSCSRAEQRFRLLNLGIKKRSLQKIWKHGDTEITYQTEYDNFSFISKNSLCQQRTG